MSRKPLSLQVTALINENLIEHDINGCCVISYCGKTGGVIVTVMLENPPVCDIEHISNFSRQFQYGKLVNGIYQYNNERDDVPQVMTVTVKAIKSLEKYCNAA